MKKGFVLKHGECVNYSRTKLYGVWQGIMDRTRNKNNPHYNLWGGRGITVCDEWKTASVFINWAKLHGYKQGLDIERLDNEKGYCPENCAFVTRSQNLLNKRKRADFGIYPKITINYGYRIHLRRHGKNYYGGVANNIDEARIIRDELYNKLNQL